MNMIYEYIISFAVAFIVAFTATPIVRKIAIKLKAIDIPCKSRNLHNKPIALMGGLAIICGFIISILFTILSSLLTRNQWLESFRDITGLFVGILIILFIGALDDIKHINAKVRLFFQLLAALAVILISNTRIEVITNPFSPVGVTKLSPYISYPLTILWIIGTTNALNLIDGLDGLAAGVASISSLTLFFVSLLTPVVGPFSSIITAALAGATLGFLPFNFNPAKIFMGSTGAYFLGFALAAVSIEGMFKSYTAISIAIPVLALGLPLFDTVFAVFRRIINKKPVTCADRGHLHHRLIDMGLSQRQSVVILYIASAALGLCAVVLTDRGALSAIILLLLVSAFIIAGARYMVGITNDAEDIDLEYLKDINPRKEEEADTVNPIENFSKESPKGSVSQENISQGNVSQGNVGQGNVSLIMKVLKKAVNR
jgi:UDP-GlcNAc:undecaprenyl-phosphate GlcNAc-1-phosphate transferase